MPNEKLTVDVIKQKVCYQPKKLKHLHYFNIIMHTESSRLFGKISCCPQS